MSGREGEDKVDGHSSAVNKQASTSASASASASVPGGAGPSGSRSTKFTTPSVDTKVTSSSSNVGDDAPRSTIASRRLATRKALKPSAFSWAAPQSLLHPTAPAEHAPLAAREKYFRRVNRPDLPFGPKPNARQRGVAVAAYVLGTAAAGYMSLFADFGEDEHVFMPLRRMLGLQPALEAHTKPVQGRRGAPPFSTSGSSGTSSAGTNAGPEPNAHAPMDGTLGNSAPSPYAGIFSLRKSHARQPSAPPPSITEAQTQADRTEALLREREEELQRALRGKANGEKGGWRDMWLVSRLSGWLGSVGRTEGERGAGRTDRGQTQPQMHRQSETTAQAHAV